MIQNYEVVILGAGPAGLSAGIYSARYGLKTLIIGKEIGGMANMAHRVDNYPGFSGSGEKLMKKFHKQAEKLGAEIVNEEIISVSKEKNDFNLTTNKRKITSKALIIAFGTQKRKLNIPGEDEFLGKGVSYCATCDAFFFKNKNVAVIGGGDSGAKAALLLSGIAKKVYMIHRGKTEGCDLHTSKMLRNKKNVKIICNSSPMEIRGKERVTSIVVDMGGKNLPRESELNVDGVFIEIGGLPLSDIARILGIQMDETNYVIADEDMKTNVPGVFAAGDVIKSRMKQIIIAASQGAMAAKSVHEYLK